jgi:hypothetical protein
MAAPGGRVPIAELFAGFPVALLASGEDV